jgi:hypothetical protein
VIQIHEYLATGRENARSSKYLMDLLHLRRRDITRAIERERREGWPICAAVSHPRGYFLAANQDELGTYCRRLAHRCGEVEQTLASLQAIDKVPIREGGG